MHPMSHARGTANPTTGKNIVICCDGTGKEYGQLPTNVVHLFETLERDSRQVAFYDPGVGTSNAFGMPIDDKPSKALGLVFGLGIRQNLAEAYGYLMKHYQPEDRVFLFGFSRGAFTVRALAGLLHKIGLLQPDSKNLIPNAIKLYNQSGKDQKAADFKTTHCRPCKPYFIGVWDTVGMLWGPLSGISFDIELKGDVNYAYHAVAIDERRRQFPVSLWDEKCKTEDQTLEQVWFPGSHSDVGGGYADRGLSDLSLEWMLSKAAAAGLRLAPESLVGRALQPSPLGTLHQSRKEIWRVSRAAPRQIPEQSKVHRSVFDRMERSYEGYNPPLPREFTSTETDPTPLNELLSPAESTDPTHTTSLDLAPFGHLVARGATGIEMGPDRVWQQVSAAMKNLPHSVLDALPKEEIRELVSHGLIIDVPAGVTVTSKGSGERELFVVLGGEFEVIDGDRHLSSLGIGEIFGEVAFFQPDGRRIASVKASTPGRVLVLQSDQVEQLLQQRPALATPLLQQLGSIMAGRIARPAASQAR